MTALKATALKNRILKAALLEDRNDYVFDLKNQNAGVSTGCSGFITNTATGRVVYVTTDVGSYASKNIGDIMFRTAESGKDYRGGRNQWGAVEFSDTFAHLLATLA